MIWNFDRYANNIALIDEYGNEVTYGELEKTGNSIVSLIDSRCLVFCMCTNSIGSIMGYSAFVNNRIVPVMLNAYMESELRDRLIGTYNPKYLWMPEDVYKELNDSGVSAYEVIHRRYSYVLVKTNLKPQYELYDDLCVLLTTSGSTGSPKFVRQSYKNVISNTESIVEYLQIDETERPITTLPMNYTYGLSIINTHLYVGATILVTDKGLMQKEFWSLFKEQKATSFGGVPYTYEMLERLRFARMELPSLRYMTQAGGKITPELHKKFAEYANERGVRFVVMYGQCEATARMGYLPADKAIDKCGSMGIVIPGGKFMLIDPDGQEITSPHVAGELVYEGDNVTLGYAECGEDLKKGDERKGILHTGDVAEMDEDGYYYIVGRMKRFLKIYGNRVNLDEVERMLKGEFAGIDVACAGVDDHMKIYVTDETLTDAVKKYVVSKTKLNPTAFKVVVIDEIPKNDSGKTLYSKLDNE